MRRLALIIAVLTMFINYCFAQTQVKSGNLTYSLEKGTTASELFPAAEAYSRSSGGYLFNVRFPGYKYFVPINGSGWYYGWSGERNSSTGVITVTSPRGYIYTFDNGDEPNNKAGKTLKLTSITNHGGYTEGIYTYDANGRVSQVKENNSSDSVYMQFGYNTAGQLTTLTTVDPSVSSSSSNYSRIYSLTYDSNDRVVAATSSSGSGCGCSGAGEDWLTDVYDANDQLIAQKDSTGLTIYTYTYHSNGSLSEKRDKDGNLIRQITYESFADGTRKMKVYNYVDLYNYRYSETLYNTDGDIKSETVYKELRDSRIDPNLCDTTCFTTYYVFSGLTEIVIPDGGDPNGNTGVRTYNDYDSDHQLTSEVQYDTNGNSRTVVSNSYANGRLTYSCDLRESKTTYDYISGTALLNKHKLSSDGYNYDYYYRYLYDSQNRKITEELRKDESTDDGNDPLIQTTHYEYDKYGNVCKEYRNGISNRSDPNSYVTEYVYNAFGNLVWQISPDGVVTGKTYDGAGRVENEFVLAGGIADYNEITNPLSCNLSSLEVISHTKYQYNSVYGKVETVSSAVDSNTFTYNSPEEWTVTLYGYDSYGRKITERKDYLGLNLLTTYQYNKQNEIELVTYADGHSEQTIRDGRGLTVSTIKTGGTNSITSNFTYDNRGNLVQTKVNNVIVNSYTYDDFGRRTAIYNGALTDEHYSQYSYDGGTDDVEIEEVWDKDSSNNAIRIKQTFKAYDVFGKVIYEQQYADPSTSSATNDKITFYRYNILGNLTMTAHKGVDNSFYPDPMFGGYDYNPGSYYGSFDGDIIELRKYNGNSQLSAVIKFDYPEISDLYYDQEQQMSVNGFFDFGLDDTEADILANDPNISFVKYNYCNSQLGSQNIYTGIKDGELTFATKVSYEYDDAGRAVKTFDADENYTTAKYDSLNRQIENTLWQGKSILRLNDASNPDFEPYPIRRTLTAYNTAGLKDKTAILVDPNINIGIDDVNTAVDKVVSYVYNSYGQLYREKEIFGKNVVGNDRKSLKEYTYDALGRVSLVEMGELVEISFGGSTYEDKTVLKSLGYHYNGMGQQDIETVTDVNTYDQTTVAFATYYTFDNQGRGVQIENEDGTLALYEYDTLGRKIKETDFAGMVTTLNYNGMGYLTSTVEDSTNRQRTTTFGYDRNGLRTSIGSGTDTTTYTYNCLDKVESIEYPDEKVIEYGYDMQDNITSRTVTQNSQSITTRYKRNALGRICYKQYSDNPNWQDPCSLLPFDEILYDAAGNKEIMANIDGSSDLELLLMGYDGLGNLVSSGESYSNFSYSVHYSYDQRGLLKSVEYPEERSVVYSRDALGRVESVSYDGQTVAQYYYLGDKVVKKTIGGIEYNATVDDLGRISGEKYGNMTLAYGYLNHTPRLMSRNSIDYGYDSLGRVISEENTSYTCDLLGNPMNATEDNLTYTLDNEDRVTGVADSVGSIAAYNYDRQGRRTSKTIDGVTTFFAYDKSGNIIAEYQRTGSQNVWKRDYIYGANGELVNMYLSASTRQTQGGQNLLAFADAWLCAVPNSCYDSDWDRDDSNDIDFFDYALAVNDGDFNGITESRYRYILTDLKGSVVGMTDANGVITSITYNAWGQPSYTGDLEGLSVLWNGYYYDYETGNYYLRNRYYSPVERKFITQDPRGVNPDGNWNNGFSIYDQYGDGFNLYEYARSNPILGIDSTGLEESYTGSIDPSEFALTAFGEDALMGGFSSTWDIRWDVTQKGCGSKWHVVCSNAKGTYGGWYLRSQPFVRGHEERHKQHDERAFWLAVGKAKTVGGACVCNKAKADCYSGAISQFKSAYELYSSANGALVDSKDYPEALRPAKKKLFDELFAEYQKALKVAIEKQKECDAMK